MKCKKHPRYKALKKPRCECYECWQMFVKRTADYQMVCKEIEWRTKEESGTTYARGFFSNESAIVSLLKGRKRAFEEEFKKEKENENSDK